MIRLIKAVKFFILNNKIGVPEVSLIDDAKELVEFDRRADYGDVNESFTRIAGMWAAYLGIDIKPLDVAQMMILLKVSRSKTSPFKIDNLQDIVGYTLCYEQLMGKVPETEK